MQIVYFGFFIFQKITEFCRFVTYLSDDPRMPKITSWWYMNWHPHTKVWIWLVAALPKLDSKPMLATEQGLTVIFPQTFCWKWVDKSLRNIFQSVVPSMRKTAYPFCKSIWLVHCRQKKWLWILYCHAVCTKTFFHLAIKVSFYIRLFISRISWISFLHKNWKQMFTITVYMMTITYYWIIKLMYNTGEVTYR